MDVESESEKERDLILGGGEVVGGSWRVGFYNTSFYLFWLSEPFYLAFFSYF